MIDPFEMSMVFGAYLSLGLAWITICEFFGWMEIIPRPGVSKIACVLLCSLLWPVVWLSLVIHLMRGGA